MSMTILLAAAAVREWRLVWNLRWIYFFILTRMVLSSSTSDVFLQSLIDDESLHTLQSRDTSYVTLNDGRKLCLECLETAIMDTSQCQPLYLEVQEFYERLNMRVEQQIPLLLVERQALNDAREFEKHVRNQC